MSKNLIIFDFFGVISSEMSVTWFKKHFPLEQAKILKDKYCIPGDLGQYTIDEVVELIARDMKMDPVKIRSDWEALISIHYDLVDYIKELRQKNYVVLLSNASKNLVEGIMDKYQLNDVFDDVLISANVKIAKPDPRIYQMMLDKYKGKYNKAIMTDDNWSNLCFLEDLGIIPILFTGIEDFKSKLSVILGN